MLSRRSLLIGAGVAAAGAGAAYYVWPGVDPRYQAILDETHKRLGSWPEGKRALMEQLVRHATLAANSHNTQPWIFRVRRQHHPHSRRCRSSLPGRGPGRQARHRISRVRDRKSRACG